MGVSIPFAAHIIELAGAFVMAFWRAKLREKLGNPAPRRQFGVDALMFCLCRWCVAAQEAQAVDTAWGLSVECPMTVFNKGALVGQPYAVAQGVPTAQGMVARPHSAGIPTVQGTVVDQPDNNAGL